MENNEDINKLYLPILFLIRQSIELGLKANIYGAQEMSDYTAPNWVSRNHSLKKLFKQFSGERSYFSMLDLSCLDEETMQDISTKSDKLKLLTDKISMLDKDSYYLRYPVNAVGQRRNINFKRDTILEIISAYYDIDSFLTFINQVLLDNGVLVDYSEMRDSLIP
ncbi:hypothetical protein [Carboxylicivirga caseinilyticus]|uniref:hypothetical protein n=1 Tax=Carboxylicivirga caseinilyticus TaxID=3417572 RepID=UPI003D356881|nr:hypothetical protein [Marinilabiliaceae bacterium A049]